MSGEPGSKPALPGEPLAKPLPGRARFPARSGRELKARIWLGLPLAVVGAYLLGDTSARFQLAWGAFAVWWPWLLLALAAANVLRSMLRLESLIAPGLLAFAALAVLGFREGIATRMLLNTVVPAVLAVTGLALMLSVGAGLTQSWTRILVTGRVVAPEPMSGGVRPRAILGELKADLSLSSTPPEEVRVTAVFGHVLLTIPATWQLDLHATGTLLTPIRGLTGTGPPVVKLRVLGFCGVVSVVRVPRTIPEGTAGPQE